MPEVFYQEKIAKEKYCQDNHSGRTTKVFKALLKILQF